MTIHKPAAVPMTLANVRSHIRMATDCLSRAADGLCPELWERGDLGYTEKQLDLAADKVTRALAAVRQRNEKK